jgi:hypothetical protein
MSGESRIVVRFVRALVAAGAAVPDADGMYRIGSAALGRQDIDRLHHGGVLELTGNICRPRAEARTWLRRQLLAGAELGEQHRVTTRKPDGTRINLTESPLSRLAVAAAGEATPFLEKHQVEAGERVRRLAERARLQPRVTMNYSGAHTAGGKGAATAAEITDMAAEARVELARLYRLLPRECAEVILDVCGLCKGLQTIETERGWPRRSAKLVLRIGLEQLAQRYGYASSITGAQTRRPHAWLDEGARPHVFE